LISVHAELGKGIEEHKNGVVEDFY
jgi:hypothetical protein